MLYYLAPPSPPGALMINLSSGSPLTVSWSPPSDPVEGGVDGYVFGVTGEGCGCVSMNLSANTTSLTCSGWIAACQTCSFEVRTFSQDCGFYSNSTLAVKLSGLMMFTTYRGELGFQGTYWYLCKEKWIAYRCTCRW